MNVFLDRGTLKYDRHEPKLVVEVDPGIAHVALALIPPHFQAQPTRWPTHITGIRNEAIENRFLHLWGKYDGESVDFVYSAVIRNDDVYFWYEAACGRLDEIREELGLPRHSQWTRPPDGSDMFHITVANRKAAAGIGSAKDNL